VVDVALGGWVDHMVVEAAGHGTVVEETGHGTVVEEAGHGRLETT
jgi:hypothetical protein